MATNGGLPARICCHSCIQFLHASRMCCTIVARIRCRICRYLSVLLMAWGYARMPILPVRICMITKLTARCRLSY